MAFYGLTDEAIATEIGRRLKTLRLNKNYSQEEMIEKTGLSIKAIRNAEKGKSTLATYIAVLRALNALDALENFIPETRISPLQLAKMNGKQRLKASRKRSDS